MWVRGLIYGVLVVIFSNWLLVPFIKGTIFKLPNQAFFGGLDAKRMMTTVVILCTFGLAVGLIHGLLRRRH
jgi:hypothetical protein